MPIPNDWPGFWQTRHFPGIVTDFVHNGSLVFDIGANIGKMTWMYRRLNARVIAVEPQDGCVKRMQATFVDDENVLIIHAACGASSGEVTMACYGGTTISTLVPEYYWQQGGPWENTPTDWTERVKMITLDDLIAQCGIPDFIKIDVEGYEYQVLQGLSQFVPLSFEYHPFFNTRAYECIERILELEPSAEFTNSDGESLIPEGNWCGLDEMKGRVDSLKDRFGRLYFGNMYARRKQ